MKIHNLDSDVRTLQLVLSLINLIFCNANTPYFTSNEQIKKSYYDNFKVDNQ